MDHDENRSWMYNMFYENMGLRKSYVDGVDGFIAKAKLLPEYIREGSIKCPCVKCKCSHVQPIENAVLHLYRKGFMPNYFVWTAHGECNPSVHRENFQNDYVGYNYPMNEMLNDAFGMYQGEPSQPNVEEIPNNEAKLFYEQLEEANRPFYEGASHSKLSVAKLKIYWQTPEFLAQSEQAKKNIASAKRGSKHTCGSVSLATHRARYEAVHGKVSDYEFFRLFHYLYDEQGNEVGWLEPRAQQLEENYKALHQEWLESQGSQVVEGSPKPTPEEENAMFVQAGGGYTSKNRAYGLGPSRYKKPSRVGIVNANCSSSSSPAPQVVDDDLRSKLAEMEQRLLNSERQRLADRENVKKLEKIVATIWRDKEQGSGSSQRAD